MCTHGGTRRVTVSTLNIVPYGLICFVNKYENVHDTGELVIFDCIGGHDELMR